MIAVLLVITFVIAFAVASLIVLVFRRPVESILKRVVPPELSYAWTRYLGFAIYVMCIGGGVRVWDFEKYLTAQDPSRGLGVVPLTADRWMLEVFNTIIGALQSAAGVLLVFFVFALVAVVIVRLFEGRAPRPAASK